MNEQTEGQAPEQKPETEQPGQFSGLTSQQQIERMADELAKYGKQVIEIVQVYGTTYPPATTAPEVIDAVTVPVPYRLFMLMAGISVNVIGERKKAKIKVPE